MSKSPSSWKFFTISGTGVARAEWDLHSSTPGSSTPPTSGVGGPQYFNGRVKAIKLRQPASGTATAVTFYLVHNKQHDIDPATLKDENIVVETASLVPTASDTATFLDTVIDAKPTFQSSLVGVLDVTAAAGAWSFVVAVELEG